MSTEQATFDDCAFEQAEPEPRDEPETLFERLTGETTTVERQQPDGDRVVTDVPIDLRDGLEEALEGQEVME